MEKKFYSPKDVSEIYGIKVSTLSQWRTMGIGPSYYKLGALVKYKPHEVDAWVEEQKILCCCKGRQRYENTMTNKVRKSFLFQLGKEEAMFVDECLDLLWDADLTFQAQAEAELVLSADQALDRADLIRRTILEEV